ncbi:hypothetical protein [Aquibaculum sediminis]|uniref:hypothetical protein n=1 Tax=Aquibaculum sediminis TaxID=3231907 RepID=UPI0034512EBA
MRKTILAAALALMPVSAGAEETKMDFLTCGPAEEYAWEIMAARQRGVSIGDVMLLTDVMEEGFWKQYLKSMTIAAYRFPVADSEQGKYELVSDFANKVAIECYEALYSIN